jgi:hypothetical protein
MKRREGKGRTGTLVPLLPASPVGGAEVPGLELEGMPWLTVEGEGASPDADVEGSSGDSEEVAPQAKVAATKNTRTMRQGIMGASERDGRCARPRTYPPLRGRYLRNPHEFLMVTLAVTVEFSGRAANVSTAEARAEEPAKPKSTARGWGASDGSSGRGARLAKMGPERNASSSHEHPR